MPTAIASMNGRLVIDWLESIGMEMPANAREIVIRIPADGLPTIEIHSYLDSKIFEVEAPFKVQ